MLGSNFRSNFGRKWHFSDLPILPENVGWEGESGSGSDIAKPTRMTRTGHGVTTELKEKLFLPYFSTKKRGTGLGLAIVSRIVEDHHGSIRVEENFPVGARFIVEVPLAPQQESQSTTSQPSHA